MKWTVALALVAATGLGGCTDYGPIEKELKDMHTQLSQVERDVSATKASLDQATLEARHAAQAAEAAQSTANQALALAQSDQQAIDRLNERLDQLDHTGRPVRKPVKKAQEAPPPKPVTPKPEEDNPL
jgi:chromosome segregation ATPase